MYSDCLSRESRWGMSYDSWMVLHKRGNVLERVLYCNERILASVNRGAMFTQAVLCSSIEKLVIVEYFQYKR
jgi:hypothetical protein